MVSSGYDTTTALPLMSLNLYVVMRNPQFILCKCYQIIPSNAAQSRCRDDEVFFFAGGGGIGQIHPLNKHAFLGAFLDFKPWV